MGTIDSNTVIHILAQHDNRLADDQNILQEDHILTSVFHNALTALKDILDRSDSLVSNLNEISKRRALYGYGSNIIAFCAPRGQGKTSAMLSFSRALENCHRGMEQSRQHELWKEVTKDRNFHVMPPIDPTLLSDCESVIELILAWLFQQINECWKKNAISSQDECEKIRLLEHFQSCRQCLYQRKGGKGKDFDDLGAFLQSGNVFDLKYHLCEIIEAYFRLNKGSAPGNSYLIIQLDDTDMQLENAYDILEEVRKYLSVPCTVVLMATYLRQLRLLISTHYEKMFGSESSQGFGMDTPALMAARYIDKLIPASQTIHLTSIRRRREVTGLFRTRELVECGEQVPAYNDVDIEVPLMDVIYEKTGLVFLKHKSYLNNIFPQTLRGLTHLCHMLDAMETPKKTERPKRLDKEELEEYYKSYIEYKKKLQDNLITFESYFYNDWCPGRLTERDQRIILSLHRAYPAIQLNLTVNLLDNRIQNRPERRKIDHYSYLDVLAYISYFNNNAQSMEDYALLFALSVHYSIQINKLINEDEIDSLNSKIAAFDDNPTVEMEEPLIMEYKRMKDFFKAILDRQDLKKPTVKEYQSLAKAENISRMGEDAAREAFNRLFCFLCNIFQYNFRDITFQSREAKEETACIIYKHVAYICANCEVQHAILHYYIKKQEDESRKKGAYDRENETDPIINLLRNVKKASGISVGEKSILDALDDIEKDISTEESQEKINRSVGKSDLGIENGEDETEEFEEADVSEDDGESLENSSNPPFESPKIKNVNQ